MEGSRLIFSFALLLLISQRFYELCIAKRNTRLILENGGVEFGARHYWMLVLLHSLFFSSLILEALTRGIYIPSSAPWLFAFFIGAQAARIWIIRTMGGRWTTRILVIPGETLVSRGPFRFIAHPNYTVVAIEILVFPLAFGLGYTALVFTVLNAFVLLAVRIPEERRALKWAQAS